MATDWPFITLGESGKWLSGGTPDTSKADYWNGDIPWISASSLHNFYIADSDRRITNLGAQNGTRLVPKDTIIFIVRGMSLKTEFRVGITQRQVAFGQDCKAIIPKPNIDPLYLANVLRAYAPDILNLADEASHGTGRLQTDALAQLEIPLPPLPEQRTIAQILGALDDKIELNRRMNETLEAIARAIFKSWFVDFDPVRAKAEGRQPYGMDAETAALFPDGFEDSALGEVPRGWRVVLLKDITSKIGSGATPRGGSSVYIDDGVAFIRSQNIHDHDFRWDGLVHLTHQSAQELLGVEVKVDDILLNITGDSILRTCIVDPVVLPARVSQHVAIIRAQNGIPPRFIHQYLVQPSVKSQLLSLNTGATRQAITKGHLESVQILRPKLKVLHAFQDVTNSIFSKIDLNRAQSHTLIALRSALLPQLISGKISVNEVSSLLVL